MFETHHLSSNSLSGSEEMFVRARGVTIKALTLISLRLRGPLAYQPFFFRVNTDTFGTLSSISQLLVYSK